MNNDVSSQSKDQSELSDDLRNEQPNKVPVAKAPKALIVDDSELTRLIMKLMLEELGFEVELAANAEAAIVAVRRERFDVITMDYHMPSVDGLECLRLIKKQVAFANAHSAIFAATSEDDGATRMRFIEAGVDDFIEKPLSIEGLRSKIFRKAA